LIYRGVRIHSQIFAQPGEKGSEVELDGEVGRDV